MIAGPAGVLRKSRVLIADDMTSVLALFEKLLISDGHDVIMATDGEEALASVYRERPDVVILDVSMPKMNGLDVCRRLKADPEVRLTPVVLVTGLSEIGDRIRGIEAGADDFLTKPVHSLELRARITALTRMKAVLNELDSAEAAFMTLALTIEARDPNTSGHCERLAERGVLLGRALGLSDDDLAALHRGGYLHDVGKIGVPDSILLKPGPLTAEEFAVMKTHPDIGDALCAPLRSLRNVRPIVKCHHERIDGRGYPQGLRGDEVPLLAQLISVVDVYDALTSKRPYRNALRDEVARQYLLDEARRGRYSSVYVEAFLDILSGVRVASVA
jgi:putative two-component system response regulator